MDDMDKIILAGIKSFGQVYETETGQTMTAYVELKGGTYVFDGHEIRPAVPGEFSLRSLESKPDTRDGEDPVLAS